MTVILKMGRNKQFSKFIVGFMLKCYLFHILQGTEETTRVETAAAYV